MNNFASNRYNQSHLSLDNHLTQDRKTNFSGAGQNFIRASNVDNEVLFKSIALQGGA
jgi:hypothetical protein